MADIGEDTTTLCDGVVGGAGKLLTEIVEREGMVDTSAVLEHPGGDISLPFTDDGLLLLTVIDALYISSVLRVGCGSSVCAQLRCASRCRSITGGC